MSSKTADTEEETLESPTPPKTAPLSPDQREDDILEEEDETDQVHYNFYFLKSLKRIKKFLNFKIFKV